MTERTLDQGAVDAFAARVFQDWGGAHIVALAYVGDRLGAFRALADAGPAMSQRLAGRSGFALAGSLRAPSGGLHCVVLSHS